MTLPVCSSRRILATSHDLYECLHPQLHASVGLVRAEVCQVCSLWSRPTPAEAVNRLRALVRERVLSPREAGEVGENPPPVRLTVKTYDCPGDTVALTATLRDLHAAYPGRFLTDVRTPQPELWRHNPHVTPLNDDDPDNLIVELRYADQRLVNARPTHMVRMYTELLEVVLELRIPSSSAVGHVPLGDDERALPPALAQRLPSKGFWIVVSGGKRDYTTKRWRLSGYQAVVDHFRERVTFAQCGAGGDEHARLRGVVDLVGRTTLREFVQVMHHAEGVLCGLTFAMHLAAAVETRPGGPPRRPCVVIGGGREPPHWYAYPGHQVVTSVGALPCCAEGGCWRGRVVPLGDGSPLDGSGLCVDPVRLDGEAEVGRCMAIISTQDVIRAVERYYEAGALRYAGARP